MLRKLSLIAALAGALAIPTAGSAWDDDDGWEHHGGWEHGDWDHGGWGHPYGWHRGWGSYGGYGSYYRRRCWAWNGWQWAWAC